jgi:hypothetical protein
MAAASGIDRQNEELRRRNVGASAPAGTKVVDAEEKSKEKVWYTRQKLAQHAEMSPLEAGLS